MVQTSVGDRGSHLRLPEKAADGGTDEMIGPSQSAPYSVASPLLRSYVELLGDER